MHSFINILPHFIILIIQYHQNFMTWNSLHWSNVIAGRSMNFDYKLLALFDIFPFNNKSILDFLYEGRRGFTVQIQKQFKNHILISKPGTHFIDLKLHFLLFGNRNIAKGETSQAITSFHFFDYFNYFGLNHKITFITKLFLSFITCKHFINW